MPREASKLWRESKELLRGTSPHWWRDPLLRCRKWYVPFFYWLLYFKKKYVTPQSLISLEKRLLWCEGSQRSLDQSLGEEGRNDSLACWNLSSLHRGFWQLYQGLHKLLHTCLSFIIYVFWLLRKLKALVQTGNASFRGWTGVDTIQSSTRPSSCKVHMPCIPTHQKHNSVLFLLCEHYNNKKTLLVLSAGKNMSITSWRKPLTPLLRERALSPASKNKRGSIINLAYNKERSWIYNMHVENDGFGMHVLYTY